MESMLGRRDAKDNPRGYGIARNFGITGFKNRTGDPLNRFKPHPHESEYFWNRILFYTVRPPAPHKTSQSAHRHQERIILSCRHRIFLKPLFREDILDPTVLVNLCGRQKPRYFWSPLRRFGLHMPTREKIANVNNSVDCWNQINPIHQTEFAPTQVKYITIRLQLMRNSCGRGLRPLAWCLPLARRARSFLRPLLPSACYAGY